jgi:predicted small metal-binding protein
MAYTMACRDSGVDCPGEFTTETKEELIKHVQLHAQQAHPGLELSEQEVEAKIRVKMPV